MAKTPNTRKSAARAKKATPKKAPARPKKPAKRTAAKKPSAKRTRKTAGKSSPPSSGRQLSVRAAVQHDIDQLAKRDPAIATSARAATALAMAKAIDNPKASPTSKSMCARVLNDTLDRMLELAPPAKENDELDKLRSKRAARRATSAA